MWPHIVEKVAVFGSEYFDKNLAKKYQKQEFFSRFWGPNQLCYDVSIVSFFQSFFFVLMTGMSAVRKYLWILV